MMHVKLIVTLTLIGPVLTRASAGAPLGVDAVAARTPDGRLYLPFSLVKGRLRQVWGEIAPALPRTINDADWLGTKSTDGDKPSRGRLRFSDFVRTGAITEKPEGRLHRVRIDSGRHAAHEGALQIIESPIGVGEEAEFRGDIEFVAADTAEAERMSRDVEVGLNWIPNFGGERAVGFGRLAKVTVDRHQTPITLDEAVGSNRGAGAVSLDLVIAVQEAFCVARRPPSHNVFESETILAGAVLKGAIASAANAMLGRDLAAPLDETVTGPMRVLARNFARLRFTCAFSAPNGVRVRPVVLPLSLVKDGKGDWWDVALLSEPKLIGQPPRAPVFGVDWKDNKDVRREFGWAEPPRELRVRTAIDWNRRRAMDEQLFAYEMVVPDGFEWLARVDLSQVLEAEQAEVIATLDQILSSVPARIGKTKARTEISIHPSGTISDKYRSRPEPLEGRWLVCLQTPALLADPHRLDEGSGETELRAAYEAAWEELHGGLLSLERFFASQSLLGGYLVHRFRPREPYNPFLLTDPGSVFVFTPAKGATTEDVQALMAHWLGHGLPLPAWAKERYRDDWQTCPFRPEEGFGEIAVNLPCHSRRPEVLHDV